MEISGCGFGFNSWKPHFLQLAILGKLGALHWGQNLISFKLHFKHTACPIRFNDLHLGQADFSLRLHCEHTVEFSVFSHRSVDISSANSLHFPSFYTITKSMFGFLFSAKLNFVKFNVYTKNELQPSKPGFSCLPPFRFSLPLCNKSENKFGLGIIFPKQL